MKEAKKILTIIYSLCVFFFILSYAQLIFNKINIMDYLNVRVNNYGAFANEDLVNAVSDILLVCVILCTVVIVGIFLHFFFFELSKKYSQSKNIIISFVSNIIINIICLVCLCLLPYYGSLMKTYIPEFNSYYPEAYNYNNYIFVAEASALLVIPSVTGIMISCANLANIIRYFIINKKTNLVNTPKSE